MYALRIIAMLGLAAAVPSVALESIPAAASPTASTTIVVETTARSAPRADYASIAEAVSGRRLAPPCGCAPASTGSGSWSTSR